MKEDGKMAKDVLQDVLVKQGLVLLEQPEEEEEATMKEKNLRHKEAPVLARARASQKKVARWPKLKCQEEPSPV